MNKKMLSVIKQLLVIAYIPLILYMLYFLFIVFINLVTMGGFSDYLFFPTDAQLELYTNIFAPPLFLLFFINVWEKYDFKSILRDAVRRSPGEFLQRLPRYTNFQLLHAVTHEDLKQFSPQVRHFIFSELRKRNLCDDDELKAHELKRVFAPEDDLVVSHERYILTKTLFVTGTHEEAVQDASHIVRVASISSVVRGKTRFLPYFLEPDYLKIFFSENGKTDSVTLSTRIPESWVNAFASIGIIVKNEVKDST